METPTSTKIIFHKAAKDAGEPDESADTEKEKSSSEEKSGTNEGEKEKLQAPPPPKQIKPIIFNTKSTYPIRVFNLPSILSINDLRAKLEQFGRVSWIEIIKRDNSAFARIETKEEGLNAIKCLDGMEILGKKIRVTQFGKYEELLDTTVKLDQIRNTCKLYVSQLPKNIREGALRELIEPYGKVLSVEFSQKQPPYVIVEVESEEVGRLAVSNLNRKKINERAIHISKLKSSNVDDQTIFKLFVCKLPRNWTEVEIRRLFEPYGRVLRIDSDKKWTYQILHIASRLEGNRAIAALHRTEVNGRNIVVSKYLELDQVIDKSDRLLPHVASQLQINARAAKMARLKPTTIMDTWCPARLFVSNIKGGRAKTDDMRNLFGVFGRVLHVDKSHNRNHLYIHMIDEKAAQNAIENLHRTEYEGKYIVVNKFETVDEDEPDKYSILIIENVSEKVSALDILPIVEQYGVVLLIHIDRISFTARVTMSAVSDMRSAMTFLTGQTLAGQKIKVKCDLPPKSMSEEDFRRIKAYKRKLKEREKRTMGRFYNSLNKQKPGQSANFQPLNQPLKGHSGQSSSSSSRGRGNKGRGSNQQRPRQQENSFSNANVARQQANYLESLISQQNPGEKVHKGYRSLEKSLTNASQIQEQSKGGKNQVNNDKDKQQPVYMVAYPTPKGPNSIQYSYLQNKQKEAQNSPEKSKQAFTN